MAKSKAEKTASRYRRVLRPIVRQLRQIGPIPTVGQPASENQLKTEFYRLGQIR